MSNPYILSLKRNLSIKEEKGDLLLSDRYGKGMRLARPTPAQRCLLAHLAEGYLTAEQLVEEAAGTEPTTSQARLYYLLDVLEQKKWLCYTLVAGEKKLATLEPLNDSFTLHSEPVQGQYRLSRFACLRRLNEKMVMESPLGYGRVIVHHPQVAVLPVLLNVSHSVDELSQSLPFSDLSAVETLLRFMLSAGVLLPCDKEGQIAEDRRPDLRQWEFHDLLFHSRSRPGRHDNDLGGTFPFLGDITSLPGNKQPMSPRRIDLYQPHSGELEALGKDFFTVLESRRSCREPGTNPLSIKQLGCFLYCTGKTQQQLPADPERGHLYEASLRPCAAGGAIHEIEYYLTISRCEGLDPGFYHYDPSDHVLEHLGPLGPPQELLLAGARAALVGNEPDLLITLAARFQRVSWKYRSIAYTTIQKNVGCIYQQMYLVATALNLAPCALGAGDPDLFAKASGLDYYTEGSVGEFALSNR